MLGLWKKKKPKIPQWKSIVSEGFVYLGNSKFFITSTESGKKEVVAEYYAHFSWNPINGTRELFLNASDENYKTHSYYNLNILRWLHDDIGLHSYIISPSKHLQEYIFKTEGWIWSKDENDTWAWCWPSPDHSKPPRTSPVISVEDNVTVVDFGGKK